LEKSKLRLNESITGEIDLTMLNRLSKTDDEELIDVADYVCDKVEIVDIDGKGKGIVAKYDIKKGTIVVISKAFTFASADKIKKYVD